LSSTTTTTEVNNSKQGLIEARNFLKLANENIANADVFDLNIKKSEELVQAIQDKKLFLNDIEKILDDISAVKKQFNGVTSYEEDEKSLLAKSNGTENVQVIENKGKVYIIKKRSVV
jgi:hypothetical protein